MALQNDNMRGSALMVAAMAAFTVNDACMKAVTVTMPLYQAILLRGLLTVAMLLLIARYLGGLKFRLGRKDAAMVAIRSLAEVAGTVTFLTALRHMPLANISAILQVLPLAVTLAAAVVLRERIGWRRMSAILVGFAGVLMIVRPGTDGFDTWALLALLSVACVVVRDLATRRLSAQVPSVTVAVFAAASVAAMAGVTVPFTDWAPVSLTQSAQIVGASGFLIVGYLSIVMAMRVGDISVVAPFRYSALVVAIALGWLVFGQFPDAWTLTGSAIVIATGVYAFYRERRLNILTATPAIAPLRVR